MLQECFKHHNNIRGACCRSASNTPIMSVCVCRSASNTTIISGMQVAGAFQTPQSCQGCMLQECFKHPNYVNVSPIISGVHIAGVLQTF